MRMQASSKKSEQSITALIWIVSAHITHCLCAFLLLYSDYVSTG